MHVRQQYRMSGRSIVALSSRLLQSPTVRRSSDDVIFCRPIARPNAGVATQRESASRSDAATILTFVIFQLGFIITHLHHAGTITPPNLPL